MMGLFSRMLADVDIPYNSKPGVCWDGGRTTEVDARSGISIHSRRFGVEIGILVEGREHTGWFENILTDDVGSEEGFKSKCKTHP
jgi:hypothetical protein